MRDTELMNLKLSHNQSTFQHGSVVATTVIMEFTLQAIIPALPYMITPTTSFSQYPASVYVTKDAICILCSGLNKTKIFSQGCFASI